MSEQKKGNALKMDRGWKWLLYIDILLPGLLFLLALLPIASVGSSFARFFHTYSLFVMNTIPDFTVFTGILGLAAHLGILIWAAVKRRWVDLIICLAITAAVTLYFCLGWNYLLVGLLNFGL